MVGRSTIETTQQCCIYVYIAVLLRGAQRSAVVCVVYKSSPVDRGPFIPGGGGGGTFICPDNWTGSPNIWGGGGNHPQTTSLQQTKREIAISLRVFLFLHKLCTCAIHNITIIALHRQHCCVV